MTGQAIDRIPGGYGLLAIAVAARRDLGRALASLRGAGARPPGLAADPIDLRPADPRAGARILAGAFMFDGETVNHGAGGDPWDRASPSRRFAAALHRFDWLRDLIALGDTGAAEALRLILEWRRVFGRGNAFSWSPDILERRVFNLACAARAVCAPASDAETLTIAADLARQARTLLAVDEGPLRAAERATAAAVAGTALGGSAGARLLDRALRRLEQVLPRTVTPDGGHASRSPQAALELYFDLQTLDDALVQRGAAAPEELLRALDRLGSAVQFFTLPDGRLPAFQGGEALSPGYVAAARSLDEPTDRTIPVARNGYHRLQGRSLLVVADAAGAAIGAWSATACAQPLAIEVLAGGRRLIIGGGGSADAAAPQALRLIDAASTASIGDLSCGEPLRGFAARMLGPRLRDAPGPVEAERRENEAALWLDLEHDGWARHYGLRHERRLYLDRLSDELRGEDSLRPLNPGRANGRRFAPFAVRFQLHPQVSALIAQDRKSVLLKAEGDDTGWWLRSDALEMALEPSVHIEGGRPRRSQQVVLRGQVRLNAGARVRWKLSNSTPQESR